MCGLCGQCTDTYRFGDGSVVAIEKSGSKLNSYKAMLLGNSWMVNDPLNAEEDCEIETEVAPPCSGERKQIAEDMCKIIKDPAGPFSACHATVDPTEFYDECEFDVCEDATRDRCEIMAAYVNLCTSKGISLNAWRSAELCRNIEQCADSFEDVASTCIDISERPRIWRRALEKCNELNAALMRVDIPDKLVDLKAFMILKGIVSAFVTGQVRVTRDGKVEAILAAELQDQVEYNNYAVPDFVFDQGIRTDDISFADLPAGGDVFAVAVVLDASQNLVFVAVPRSAKLNFVWPANPEDYEETDFCSGSEPWNVNGEYERASDLVMIDGCEICLYPTSVTCERANPDNMQGRDDGECGYNNGMLYRCDGADCADMKVSGTCPKDVDECAEGLDDCPANSDCINNNGAYICRCRAGFPLMIDNECKCGLPIGPIAHPLWVGADLDLPDGVPGIDIMVNNERNGNMADQSVTISVNRDGVQTDFYISSTLRKDGKLQANDGTIVVQDRSQRFKVIVTPGDNGELALLELELSSDYANKMCGLCTMGAADNNRFVLTDADLVDINVGGAGRASNYNTGTHHHDHHGSPNYNRGVVGRARAVGADWLPRTAFDWRMPANRDTYSEISALMPDLVGENFLVDLKFQCMCDYEGRAEVQENGQSCAGEVWSALDCSATYECRDGEVITTPRTCSDNSECINRAGELVCECKEGFKGDGNMPDGCKEDINECAINTALCSSDKQRCENTEGSYRCVCRDGYRMDANNNCVDQNECMQVPNPCPDNSQCINLPGGYSCQCCAGYDATAIGTCARNEGRVPDAWLALSLSVGGRSQCCAPCPYPQCINPASGPINGCYENADGTFTAYAEFRFLYEEYCLKRLVASINIGRWSYGNCPAEATVGTEAPAASPAQTSAGTPPPSPPPARGCSRDNMCGPDNVPSDFNNNEQVCGPSGDPNQQTYPSYCAMLIALCNVNGGPDNYSPPSDLSADKGACPTPATTSPAPVTTAMSAPPDFGDWGPWSECTSIEANKNCGPGVIARSRQVLPTSPADRRDALESELYQTDGCFLGPCPTEAPDPADPSPPMPPRCPDFSICNSARDPVCGQIGSERPRTYSSQCMFDLLACERDEPKVFLYSGDCQPDDSNPKLYCDQAPRKVPIDITAPGDASCKAIAVEIATCGDRLCRNTNLSSSACCVPDGEEQVSVTYVCDNGSMFDGVVMSATSCQCEEPGNAR
nr:hypothetical protein BaRGS_030435 [Batillaria attramentaria]